MQELTDICGMCEKLFGNSLLLGSGSLWMLTNNCLYVDKWKPAAQWVGSLQSEQLLCTGVVCSMLNC